MLISSLRIVAAAALLASAAGATVVESAAGPAGYNIEARARNGRTGFEAVLFTPGNPSPGNALTQLNAPGAPAWRYGLSHSFQFQYTAATGASRFSIDFNRDFDFLDVEETAVSVSPTLAGYGFNTFNVFGQGNGIRDAAVFVLIINEDSVNVGNLSSNGAPGSIFNQSYVDTNGAFGDILVEGLLSFSGSANDERPRVWFRLGDPVLLDPPATAVTEFGATGFAGLGARQAQRGGFKPSAPTFPIVFDAASPVGGVPEPASWALLIGGFGCVGGTLRRRRAVAA